MTKKQAHFIRHILGGSHANILTALSSEYSEQDELEFRSTFGVSFSEAEKAFEELRLMLDNKRK